MASKQNQEESKRSVFLKSLFCGAAGAFIWGIISSIAYFFSFSEVSHGSFILRSFFSGSWTEGITGELISLAIITVLGVLPALVYYLLMKNLHGVMPGIMFGIGLWVLVFIIMNPMFYYVPTFYDLSSDTIVTTICQFVLYGVFVGYTISYEHHDRRIVANHPQKEA
ncbi:YqhR family membrane protein [Piscibacillus halophilus]|uniref:Conserved membrane protein YqhR n=1 Tax=Piscibacillus halophilus TaxID=571933 RepID=A0A1H9AAI4_9BACI|nr:YqhR family membrane protein [Piscibacillus halophilus]SEP73669.1 Conserved membrane protein YqhR [Piscibacillus halophilus]